MQLNLWQSDDWKKFQEKLGFKTESFLVDGSSALVVRRPLFLGYSYWYCQRGPIWRDGESLSKLMRQIEEKGKRQKVLFMKADPYQQIDEAPCPLAKNSANPFDSRSGQAMEPSMGTETLRFKAPPQKTHSSFEPPEESVECGFRIVRSQSHQPRATLILDLTLSDDELLAQMKQKGRYNIKLAREKGVKIVKIDKKVGVVLENVAEVGADHDLPLPRFEKAVDDFFVLLKKTTDRDGFFAHDRKYYQTLLGETASSELFLAYVGDKVVAGGIFCFEGDTAIYYYGASDYEHRECMAPYLLQWEAILEAKRRGCVEYDFLGVSDESAPQKSWAGVTEFKKKFGGRVVLYPQPVDVVFRPMWYWVYRLARFVRGLF